jgi:methylmalonyl-CoA mutase
MSQAREKVWGLHTAEIRAISGVYRNAVDAQSASVQHGLGLVEAFTAQEGRRPRIQIAKLGQDGHDRG